MNKELTITNEDIELLKEMKNNCLKSDIYNDEKRLLKANAITKFLLLQQENTQLKEQTQELRSWLEETIKDIEKFTSSLDTYHSFDYETIHELSSRNNGYKNVLSKLNELEGKNE